MLAPNTTAAQQQIVDTFNSNAVTTSAVHALENTVLQTLKPVPSWWTTINTALVQSQSQSMSWLTNTSPSLFSTSTQGYIDYATLFSVSLTALQGYVRAIKDGGGLSTPASSNVQGLVTIFNALQTVAQKNLTSCTSLQTQVDAFRAQMSANQATINTALAAALEDETSINAQIRATQVSIDSLMQQFSQYSTQANTSSISYGTSTFSLIISLTFGLAASAGTLGVATLVGAAISIGSALTTEIIYTNEMKQTITNICAQLETLGQEEVQLAMVQAVVTSLQTVMNANTSALETFTNLTSIWSQVVSDLQWLLVVLAQPQIDISKVPALGSLADANTAWQSIADFASKAQQLSLSTPPAIALPAATIPQALAA